MSLNTIKAKSIYELFSSMNVLLVLGIGKVDNADQYRHLFPDSNYNCHTCDYSNTARTQSCVSCSHYKPCDRARCVNISVFLLNTQFNLAGCVGHESESVHYAFELLAQRRRWNM